MISGHKRRKEVINQLSRSEGHIRGIKNMIEEGRSCTDLLIQLAAVNSSMIKVAKIILADHVETCLTEAIRTGEGEKYLTEITDALSKFYL